MKKGHIAQVALFLAFALGLCDHSDGAAQATPYRKPEVQGSVKSWVTGCVNAAGKARQKW